MTKPRGVRSGAPAGGTTVAGEVSEGMLFDIGYADGIRPALGMPERPVPNGARAG
jgi:hypothetical protein